MNSISKMKSILIKGLLVCAVALSVSCKDDKPQALTPLNIVLFSFKEEVRIIEVDENVKSFKLEGVFSGSNNLNYFNTNWFPVMIDTIRTTARPKFHFINNTSQDYDHRTDFNVYQEIELIPENIVGDGVEIVYHSMFPEAYYLAFYKDQYMSNPIPGADNLIYTTTIKLIPKKKEQ